MCAKVIDPICKDLFPSDLPNLMYHSILTSLHPIGHQKISISKEDNAKTGFNMTERAELFKS